MEVMGLKETLFASALTGGGGGQNVEQNVEWDVENQGDRYANGLYAANLSYLIKSLILPSGVPYLTTIATGTFREHSNLTDVTIPDGITKIDSTAFYDCTNLKHFVMSDTVEHVGGRAFYNCVKLESIKISNSLVRLDAEAFGNCTSLESITIPDSFYTNIQPNTFNNCTNLKNVKLGKNVLGIGENAFGNCTSLESITINNPNIDLESAESAIIPATTTIYGYTGSTAQTYAEKYGNEFIALD